MPRRRRGGLAAWLSETLTPVFVLDRRRVVLFFNQGCELLTGWSAADVVGRTCDYASEPDPLQVDSLTCALAPPPEAIGGAPVVAPVVIVRRDGSSVERSLHFLPLPGEADDEWRLLGVCVERAAPEAAADDVVDPPHLHAALAAVRAELHRMYQLDNLIARSPSMQRVAEQIRLAAASDVAVQLLGEPGTGREYVARLIHFHGPRRLQAFVPLDCARLSDFELKRTLRRLATPDGEHTDPAFTPGAVFLRSVSRLPRDLQQSLLEDLLAPRGADRPRLFSCDAPPEKGVHSGAELLPDLALKLTTLTIHVPPLRERPEDLPLLAQFFLEQLNRDFDRQCGGYSQEVTTSFRLYNWPGNVAELRAVATQCHAAARGPIIVAGDLPFRFRTGYDAQRTSPAAVLRSIDLAAYLEEIERREIARMLSECRQNRALAARRLGLTRPRLYRRMEQLGLDVSAGTSGSPADDDANAQNDLTREP